MTQVELKNVKKQKLKNEWIFLNSHHEDTVAKMAGEKMYVETVFKDENEDGYSNFYWYSVQGENGSAVEESESYIDKKHLEY